MSRRMLGAILWFGAIWFGFELLWSVTGVPRAAGPILGALVAMVVTLDPTGALWAAGAKGSADAVRLQDSAAKAISSVDDRVGAAR